MRHRHSGRQLGRNSSHRKAMFRNMAASLFRHERIRTTLPKAKELRRVAEPLITLSKNDAVARRRRAYDMLRDREMVTKLFNELGPRYSKRPGGYLRILKCGFRSGDNAPMAIVELVEGGDPTAGKPKKSGGGQTRKQAASRPAASSKPKATDKAEEKSAEQGGAESTPEAEDAGTEASESGDSGAGESEQTQQAADKADDDSSEPEQPAGQDDDSEAKADEDKDSKS